MDKQYPSDDKIMFLLCDAIRREQGNKVALLGVYLGGDIIVEVDAPFTLPSLAVLFHFTDGQGTFTQKFQIIDEDDKTVVEMPAKEGKKLEGVGMTSAFSIGNMTFPKIGDYRFRLSLDDHAYERTVEVKKGTIEK